MNESPIAALQAARGALDRQEAVCIATVIASTEPGFPVGWKVAIPSKAPGGSLPSDLEEAALAALARGQGATVDLRPGLTFFMDVLLPDPQLVLCGAGHIALPLSRFALESGFQVTVVDDRSDYADPARFPGCTVIADAFRRALDRLPLGRNTFVVVVTRGHAHDSECVAAVAGRGLAYLGMIGSRRRVRFVMQTMRSEGIPEEHLAPIFSPIGLPIGAASAVEIAVSILAELVAVKRLGREGAQELRAAWRRP